MEESSPYRKAHFPYPEQLNSPLQPYPMSRGKSCTHFLFKVLFVAVFIIVLPLLIPSQAPDFINESIVTKFWELLHLLFIGIAVSYGLFSRRNVEVGTEIHSKIDNFQYDMSRMFQVSSRFEDGYENPYGFDEKRVIQSGNAQYLLGEHRTPFWTGNSVVDEQCNHNLSVGENGFENSCGYGENNLIQAWNAQYFQGESMVVVAQPNCGLGEWGEPRSPVDYKPLGLPVRSLKSRIRKRENPEPVNGNESGSVSQGSSKSSVGKNEIFGDMGHGNLEDKFNEAVVSPSPIPWCSRSGRREKLSSVSHPSHFRPLSVDETQFESLRKLRTPSLRSTVSFSSHASSRSSSQGNDSPSHSVSSEVMSSKMEDEGSKTKIFQGSSDSSDSPSPPKPRNLDVKKTKSYQGSSASGSPSPPKPMNPEVRKTMSYQGSSASGSPSPPKPMNPEVRKTMSYQGSSPSGSPSPPKPMNPEVRKTMSYQGSSASGSPSPPKPMKDKDALGALHTRGYSFGSICDNNLRGPRDYLKEFSESRREDLLGSKESRPSSLKLEMKAASPTKASSRGKSVRTIRARGLTTKAYDNDDEVEKMYKNFETSYMRRATRRNESVDSLESGSSKPNLDNPCPLPKHTVPDYQKKEMQEFSEDVSAVSEEEAAASETEKFRISSASGEGAADSESVNVATPDSDEVDKKAGEFIAKFREQIRLQKVASIKRSRGLRLGGNYS